MPSLDVIRNVTIKGKADGVDDATAALNRLTASIQSANDNLAKSRAISQDNAEGFRITGEGAATAANHLRQAAEAAYAFSPAFRGVVNEMAPTAIGAANTALAAVAAGIVTATNYAGAGLIALAGAAEKASPSLLGMTTGVRSAGIAMEGFSPTVGTAASSLLSFLSPALRLVGWFALAVDGIKMVGEAWHLGGDKLAEYVALSEKATASGISIDLFQRITKASEDAKVPVDALITALANLDKATEKQLGTVDSEGNLTAGNSAQARLDQLTKAGNFQGNTGVSDLKNATDTETKYRAVLSLIDQAMDAGQRLAAIDVAKTFLGQPAADAIAKSSSSAKDMLESIDKIASETLTSQADVDRANLLKKTYDDAVTILEQRWHPIQTLLIAGGIEMQTAWVNIVSNIATAVDYMVKLLDKITQTDLSDLKWFAQKAQGGLNAVGSFFTDTFTTPESRAASEKQFGIESLPYGPQPPPGASIQERFGPFGGAASLTSRNIKDSPLYKDTSHPILDTKSPDASAYDRASESVEKYIKVTEAASLAVSDAAGEQEKLKVIAQLTAAAEKDGTPITADLAQKMNNLADRAGAAATALAKAREVSNIDFGRKTAFLSQEDVQIATQLKGIYGNDIPAALNSTYASAIRVNDAFKQVSSSIESSLTQGLTDIATGAQTAGNAFANMGKMILTAIEQMIIKITIVQPLMQALQNTISGGFGGIGGLFSVLGIGGGAPSGMGGIGHFHGGGIVGSEATFSRNVDPAVFAGAPRFHTGGIAGDEVPIIAKRGEGVFTQGQMAAMGGGGQQTVINYAPVIDARGADAQAVARLAAAMAQDRKNFERNVQAVVGRSRQNNPGAFA